MNQKKIKPANTLTTPQLLIFSFGLLFFLSLTIFGWHKLQYGFNFTDEGFHMTESWRLTQGDHFLENRMTGAHYLTNVINSFVFKLNPDITLLGFRQVQFIAALLSLIIFSIALFKTGLQFYYLPFIFSLYAVTGLDPLGCFDNLNYYTYPHLFITLSLSFFLFGLNQERKPIKKIMFIISGVMLWGVSFSLLNLSIVIAAPLIIYILARQFKFRYFPFAFTDLLIIIIAFSLCWLLFIIFFNKPYISLIFGSVFHSLSNKSNEIDQTLRLNWDVLQHIGISGIFLAIFFVCRKFRSLIFMPLLAILSIAMYFLIDTSFFGNISPAFDGWFGRPMWFASLLTAFFIIFGFSVLIKLIQRQSLAESEELAVIMLLPIILMAASRSFFSTTGILCVSYYSIPAVAALAFVTINNEYMLLKSDFIRLSMLILLFTPFYYTTSLADWEFTYFDVRPKDMTTTIQNGFGKGIRTNGVYDRLYDWIEIKTDQYTEKNDFIISYTTASMAYMIAKRRPSLDKSFIDIKDESYEYLQKSIDQMLSLERGPQMAFVFEAPPSLLPSFTNKDIYGWAPKHFQLGTAHDPLSTYIKTNMMYVEGFKLSPNNIVKCFVDKRNEKILYNLK